MFRHTDLLKRVESLPRFDRYVNTPDGRASMMVSLSVNTSPEGLLVCCISLDCVTEDRRTVGQWPMAMFSFDQQEHALADARALANYYGIDCRLATPRVGWTTDSPIVLPNVTLPKVPDFTV